MTLTAVPGVARTWAFSGAQCSYVVGVDTEPETGEARAVQRYWGPVLPVEALPEVAGGEGPRSAAGFDDGRDVAELLPVAGGLRWGVPSLQVVYPGGIRSVEFAYETADMTGDELVITLLDAHFGLRAELHVRSHGDVIERWTVLRAAQPLVVERLDSGNWPIPERGAYRYTALSGTWMGETQAGGGEIPVGELTFTSRTGTTGHRAAPWVLVGAGEETWSVALAWSGSWRMTVQRRPDGAVSVTTGFGHDAPRWPLEPGETLTTPSTYGLYTENGIGAASRAWHAHARSLLPHPDEDRPVLYNSWEATGFDVTAENQVALARRAADLGVELFVVDDGWFRGRHDDTAGLGDWTPRIDLARVVEEVRALGMAPGLWVEPEMVNPDSDLYRAHPDWVLHHPHRRRDTLRNQLVLNFARDDVRAWALAWLDDLVRTYGLAFLKWDMNRSFTQAGWPAAGERADLLWIGHTRGVYAVLDELRRRHPGLRVEACSGGGGRVDLEMLRRTDEVWTSDDTDARDRQAIQHGFTHVYPPGVMAAWVTDAPNPLTGRDVPLRYRFHVAMAGVLGIGGDLRGWTDAELAEARGLVARYKDVRPVIQHGDLYRLSGTPGVTASAVQYVRDDRVVVLAYNPYALERPPRRLRLAGLDPAARYEMEGGGTWHGRTLMSAGLTPPCWAPYGADYRSDLIVLRRR